MQLNYGTGVFEGIAATGTRLRNRCTCSARGSTSCACGSPPRSCAWRSRIPTMSLSRSPVRLVRAGEFREDVYVRPLVYKAACQIGLSMVRPTANGSALIDDEFTLFAVRLGPTWTSSGRSAATVASWRRVNDNMIPARGKVRPGSTSTRRWPRPKPSSRVRRGHHAHRGRPRE